jgi:hypothetical protein
MITFEIGSTDYQAEEGMTWLQWVDSEYNTDGYYFNSDENCIMEPAGYMAVGASPSVTIVPDRRYTIDTIF